MYDKVKAKRTKVCANWRLKQDLATVVKIGKSTLSGKSKIKWVMSAKGSCINIGTLLWRGMSSLLEESLFHRQVSLPHSSDRLIGGSPVEDDVEAIKYFMWIASTCIKGTER